MITVLEFLPRLSAGTEGSPFEAVARYLAKTHHRPELGYFVLGGLVLLGIGLALAIADWWWRTQRPQHHTQEDLFRELCAVHRLSWRERQLMTKIAASQLPQPQSLVFLDRQHLDRMCLEAGPDTDLAARLAARLFGERSAT